MPECAKTHVQQSRISKFSGGGLPGPPLQGEGRGREEREGKGKDREVRDGKGQGREEWGRGGALDMGSPPRDKLWIRPCQRKERQSLV